MVQGKCSWQTESVEDDGGSASDYRRKLEAKLEPQTIRATLTFAGIYQITHEMIKRSVVQEIRNFFCVDVSESRKRDYEREVLSKEPKRAFAASLLWLVEAGAISDAQARRLDAIYDHRHELTHELVRFVVDPDSDPDVGLLTDALEILKALDRFWSQIEIDIGSFEHLGAVDVDEVTPLSTVVLQSCVKAYIEEYVPDVEL